MLKTDIKEINAQLTSQEVKFLQDAIKDLVKLSYMARNEGLLAIDDLASKTEDLFLKLGLDLIVDGSDPTLVRQILENKYLANGYTGVEALQKLMEIETVLSVQDGESPRVIYELLRSHVKDEILSQMEEDMFDNVYKEYKKEYDSQKK